MIKAFSVNKGWQCDKLKDPTMTSFVTTQHPLHHQGAERVESVMDAAQKVSRGVSGTRALSTLLLSAMAAAVIVVAYQVMDTQAEGHLLVLWMTMWLVAFAALAFVSGASRGLAQRLKSGLDAWSRSMAQSRADQRLWAMAQGDSRVMADLQSAVMREEVRVAAEKASDSAEYDDVRAVASPYRPARAMKLGGNVWNSYPYHSA